MKKFMLLAISSVMLLLMMATPSISADEGDFGGPEINFENPVKGVSFSHKAHVGDFGFACDSCHDSLFEMQVGSSFEKGDFTMASFNKGLYCGACHNGSMAFATNTQCASCHVADGGDILYTEPVKSVVFSHRIHVDKNGLGCDSCHDGLFEMKALAAQDKDNFTMEALYKGEYCGACHDGSMAFASNTQCATCHVGVKGYRRVSGEGEKATSEHSE